MSHFLVIILLSVSYHLGYINISLANKSEIAQNHTSSEYFQTDSLLTGIQNKIYDAFVKDRMSQKSLALNELSIKLENYNKTKNQTLITYWQGYAKFYSSIFFLSTGDMKSAGTEINKGIGLIESIGKKNSEDYALLAMLQSFSIQFDNMKAMYISESIKNNANKAISLDSTNLRGWYVIGSNDFYTPEQYGGGKAAEKYLLKAISLPAQKIENTYLPSWGKEESYELLIKLYIKNEKWDLAKKYYQEGTIAYPKSYILKQLASKLTGK
jgi:hypothetical protein